MGHNRLTKVTIVLFPKNTLEQLVQKLCNLVFCDPLQCFFEKIVVLGYTK